LVWLEIKNTLLNGSNSTLISEDIHLTVINIINLLASD